MLVFDALPILRLSVQWRDHNREYTGNPLAELANTGLVRYSLDQGIRLFNPEVLVAANAYRSCSNCLYGIDHCIHHLRPENTSSHDDHQLCYLDDRNDSCMEAR